MEDHEKIVELSEAAWTPEFTLRRLLEYADGIEDIAVVMKLKDNTMSTALSTMPTEKLALLTKHLELTLDAWMREDEYCQPY